MSDITDEGYGYKHAWKNCGTEQCTFPEDRSTLYRCSRCNASFRHYYHLVPDIFTAMQYKNIPDECCPDETK